MKRVISSRDDLIGLLFDLMDHNDALPWATDRTYSYLQALAGYLEKLPSQVTSSPTANPEVASWQLFGDALVAAAGMD